MSTKHLINAINSLQKEYEFIRKSAVEFSNWFSSDSEAGFQADQIAEHYEHSTAEDEFPVLYDQQNELKRRKTWGQNKTKYK